MLKRPECWQNTGTDLGFYSIFQGFFSEFLFSLLAIFHQRLKDVIAGPDLSKWIVAKQDPTLEPGVSISPTNNPRKGDILRIPLFLDVNLHWDLLFYFK